MAVRLAKRRNVPQRLRKRTGRGPSWHPKDAGGAQHRRQLISGIASSVVQVQEQSVGTQSYEEAVLGSIGGSEVSVPNEAVLFSAMLSSMSGSMKGVQYSAGIKVGRALYRSGHASKHYVLPEESVVDLVEFFQKAGYKYVTYAAFRDKTEITIYDKKGPDFGTGLHSFEAGVIAGFMSAAHHRIMNAIELQCVHGGGSADSCKFISSPQTENPFHESEDPSSFDLLARHVAEAAKDPDVHSSWIRSEGFASGYYSLLSRNVFDKAHLDSVKVIATYLGSKVGESLGASGDGRARPAQIARAIRMLHFGNPVVDSPNPISITIEFDRLTSRREFVDAALSFVNGLLSGYIGPRGGVLVAEERIRHGSYIVQIKERTAKR